MPHVTSDGSFQQISAGFFSIDRGRIKGFELRNKDAVSGSKRHQPKMADSCGRSNLVGWRCPVIRRLGNIAVCADDPLSRLALCVDERHCRPQIGRTIWQVGRISAENTGTLESFSASDLPL